MGWNPLTHLHVPVIYCWVANPSKTEWHKAIAGVLCSLVLWIRNSDTAPWCLKVSARKSCSPGVGRVTQTLGGPNQMDASSFPCLMSAWEDSKMNLSWNCPLVGQQHDNLGGGRLLALHGGLWSQQWGFEQTGRRWMAFSNLVLGASHRIASAAGRVISQERGHRSHFLMGRVSKLCGHIVKPAHTVTNSSYWAGFSSFSVLLSPAPLLQFLEPLPSSTWLQPSSPALLWEHPRDDTVQSFNLQKKKKNGDPPGSLDGIG